MKIPPYLPVLLAVVIGSSSTGLAQEHQQPYKVDVVTPTQDTPLFPLYLVIAAIGAAVNAGVLIAIWKQNKINRDAANAAEKAAEAALLNAQAIINAERPWIIPKLDVVHGSISPVTVLGADSPATKYQTKCRLNIVNTGRTPAHILTVTMKSAFTRGGEELPDHPDYGEKTIFSQERIVGPQSEPWSLPNWAWSDRGVLTDGLWEQVHQKEKRWWRYGHVIYKNVLDGKEHETRFCYLYTGDDFIIGGPPEYTTYT